MLSKYDDMATAISNSQSWLFVGTLRQVPESMEGLEDEFETGTVTAFDPLHKPWLDGETTSTVDDMTLVDLALDVWLMVQAMEKAKTMQQLYAITNDKTMDVDLLELFETTDLRHACLYDLACSGGTLWDVADHEEARIRREMAAEALEHQIAIDHELQEAANLAADSYWLMDVSMLEKIQLETTLSETCLTDPYYRSWKNATLAEFLVWIIAKKKGEMRERDIAHAVELDLRLRKELSRETTLAQERKRRIEMGIIRPAQPEPTKKAQINAILFPSHKEGISVPVQ